MAIYFTAQRPSLGGEVYPNRAISMGLYPIPVGFDQFRSFSIGFYQFLSIFINSYQSLLSRAGDCGEYAPYEADRADREGWAIACDLNFFVL